MPLGFRLIDNEWPLPLEERKKYEDRKSNFPESLISQQDLIFDILREVYFSNKPKLLQKHRVWIYNI